MIRAFLAVNLPDELRAGLAAIQQDLKRRIGYELPPHVRLSWVRPESLHLTVKFLGDIQEALVEPLRFSLKETLARHHPLVVPLERLGGFPHLGQPRVLWIGPEEAWERGELAQRLALLHRAVETCCEAHHLATDERPLTIHLTLARIKEGGRHVGQALAKRAALDHPLSVGGLPMDKVALMQSELKQTGSVYRKLWEVPLGG